MNSLLVFFHQHPFWSAVGAYWIFSAAVSSMPTPNGSSGFYKWAYSFLHTVAGDLSAAFGSKIPGTGAGK